MAALVLASFGVGRATVQADGGQDAVATTDISSPLAAAEASAVPPVEITEPAVAPTALAPPTTSAPTTTAAPTGSARSCPDFLRLVDDDQDTWGECVVDADAAHTRAQGIVAFLGYTELTCTTDATFGTSTCDATSPDGAVHRVAILLNGDLESDVVTQEAPFDRAACTEQPPAGVLEQDPRSFEGRCLHLYGYITQFDSVTGSCGFRADVSNVRSDRWSDYDVNTIVLAESPCPFLDQIVSGDIVEIWFRSTGSMTYDTTVGGTATAVSGVLEDTVLIRHTP